MIADAAEDRALLEFLLAHELDHALEDQAFGLPEGKGAGDDEALATIALIEGSATTVMVEYGAPAPESAGAGRRQRRARPRDRRGARFYVRALTWAYLGGAGVRRRAARRRPRLVARRRGAGATRRPRPSRSCTPRLPRAEPPARGGARRDRTAAPGWRVVDRGELGEFATCGAARGRRPETGVAGGGCRLGRRWATRCWPRRRRERRLRPRAAGASACWWSSGAGTRAAEAREFGAHLPAYLVGGLGAEPRARSSVVAGRRLGAAARRRRATPARVRARGRSRSLR